MPDKIFLCIGKYEYEIENGIKKVNDFLSSNPKYEVKSVTEVRSSHTNSLTYTGAIIVVGAIIK